VEKLQPDDSYDDSALHWDIAAVILFMVLAHGFVLTSSESAKLNFRSMQYETIR
jgi:hypothetical protein